jgi:hypothetical protein
MAGNDDIPTGYGEPLSPKMRTFGRDDGVGRSAPDNDYGRMDERLELENGPDRLPWLETDDDAYEVHRPDNSRVLGFALLGLVTLAAIVGGIWWSTHRKSDNAIVADGSTISAPNAPFKLPPDDPGGKKFDGTGDSAFAVSEGNNPAAKLGETGATTAGAVPTGPAYVPPAAGAASPSVDLSKKPSAMPTIAAAKPSMAAPVARVTPTSAARATVAAAAPAAAAPAVSRGPVVQVGAYSTRASADAAWSRMVGRYSALSGQRHQVVEGQADIGRVFRLQVISGDSGSANALCSKLKAAGLACQVKS